MGGVIWSPSALEDMELIAQYIARDSPGRATLFAKRLLEATDPLSDFPESGRIIPEMNDPGRGQILVGAYRILYRISGSEVWITGIVHGARNWPHPPEK